jgi:hypothetical protein
MVISLHACMHACMPQGTLHTAVSEGDHVEVLTPAVSTAASVDDEEEKEGKDGETILSVIPESGATPLQGVNQLSLQRDCKDLGTLHQCRWYIIYPFPANSANFLGCHINHFSCCLLLIMPSTIKTE